LEFESALGDHDASPTTIGDRCAAVDADDFLKCFEAARDLVRDVNGPAAEELVCVFFGATQRVREAEAQALFGLAVCEEKVGRVVELLVIEGVV